LADDPTPLNLSPYGEGWMVLVKPDNAIAVESLLTAELYLAQLKGNM
jgi:glycine cleavage system H protein